MDEDAGRGGARARRTRRSCGPPRRCATARRRRWSPPATPAPRWPRRCCGWAGSRASAARRSPPRSRCPARRRPSCSTPAPTPRCSPSGWCSSPRWARSTPATASASTEPRVGLLSIGEEPGKGDPLRKEAYELLAGGARASDFIGNVEGRDLMTDDVDVVVTDGFTGNVVLKTLEGGMRAARSARCSTRSADAEATSAHAEALHAGAAAALRRRSTPTPTAARCCSASTACASSATARPAPRRCVNAISVAHEMVDHGLVDEIRGRRACTLTAAVHAGVPRR